MRGEKLQQAFNAYLEWARTAKGHSPRTINNHIDINGRLLRYLIEKNEEFNKENTIGYLNAQSQWKPSTRESATKRIRAWINWLSDPEHGFNFQKFHLDIPKVHKKLIHVPPVQSLLEDIIAGTDPELDKVPRNKRLRALARVASTFALETGLRNSEILRLEGKDFFLESLEYPEFVVHGKGGNEQKQPFPRAMRKEMIPLIAQSIKTGNPVFPVTQSHLNDCLQRGAHINNRSYINDARFHLLRHAFAVTLLQKGLPMVVVSQLLRHESVRTTEEYYSHLQIDFLSDQLHSNHALLQHTMTNDERYRKLIDTLNRAGFGLNNWSEVKTFDQDGWLTIRLKRTI